MGTPLGARDARGLDFGFLPKALAVGSPDFVQLLTEAHIVALAYGLDTPSQLNMRLPLLALVARNHNPLKQAFEQFAQWAATSDGDAVELTIVIRNDGFYDFALSPERSRLRQRCMGFDRVFEPLLNVVSWIKPELPISSHVREFHRYTKNVFSPFVFHGASYSGLVAGLQPDLSSARPLDDSCKILKFSSGVVEEDKAEEGTFAHSLNRMRRDLRTGSHRKLSKKNIRAADLGAAFERRERSLNCHFPVTRVRINSSSHLLTSA
jgi:hypothetical protein